MQNEKYLSNFDVAQFKWSRYIAVYNIKVVQNNCFLFYFIYNRTVVCSMFNNYSILFKINLSNKIKFVCHCYQTYCIYYFPILHQAQHHCQNFKVTYSAFVCIFTILEVITHCYCVFCLSTCLIIFKTIYIELVSFFQPLSNLSGNCLLETCITQFSRIHGQLLKLSHPQGQIIDEKSQ